MSNGTEAGGAGAFGGSMPSKENDLRTLETRGIAPIPLEHRYGGLHGCSRCGSRRTW